MAKDGFATIALTDKNVAELWPYVRRQLLRVERRIGNLALPEDVYARWRDCQLNVHVFVYQGRMAGAVALHPTADEGKSRLWVWALSFDGSAPKQLKAHVNEWLKSYARDFDLPAVAMSSSRFAWGRYLESWGWKPVLVEYELEVNHGKQEAAAAA